MKKSSVVILAIIIVAVLAGGGYAIFHKSSKKDASTASTSSTPASSNAIFMTKSSASLGQYLTDPSGKALYTFGGDSSGVSNCTGACLTNWPAYQAKSSVASLPAGVGTIIRADNHQTQYTYMGMPLYYFASDPAGQVTGNGVNSFKVAQPSSTTSSEPTPTPAAGGAPNMTSSGNPY